MNSTEERLREDNRALRKSLDSERELNKQLTAQMTRDAVLATPPHYVWLVFINDMVSRVCQDRESAEHYAGVSREKHGGEWSLMHDSYDRTRWYQRSSPSGRLIPRLEIVQREVEQVS